MSLGIYCVSLAFNLSLGLHNYHILSLVTHEIGST
jgi:hypothetical protein